MPSFTFTVPDLVSSGPTVQVLIGPSRAFIEAVGASAAAVAPIRVTAVIDTGAQMTVLSPDVTVALGIKAVGAVSILTPTSAGAVQCPQFHINVHFSADAVIENILAAQAPLIGHGFQCLIGRDVLRTAVLVYIGPENQFTLTF